MKNLTIKERCVVSSILERVKSCMTKDGTDYYDNGNFIMMMDQSEMNALKSAIKKI